MSRTPYVVHPTFSPEQNTLRATLSHCVKCRVAPCHFAPSAPIDLPADCVRFQPIRPRAAVLLLTEENRCRKTEAIARYCALPLRFASCFAPEPRDQTQKNARLASVRCELRACESACLHLASAHVRVSSVCTPFAIDQRQRAVRLRYTERKAIARFVRDEAR
jgi:hypothetical protein